MNSLACFGAQFDPKKNFECFFYQDGEADDLLAAILLEGALRGKRVTVFSAIGKKEIVYPNTLIKILFKNAISLPGATGNTEYSYPYVNAILETSLSGKQILVLHTASFANLQLLFERANPGQLSNVYIATYGSVNMEWGLGKEQRNYDQFFTQFAKSGAQMVIIDGGKSLSFKNKITHRNTPLCYTLLQHLDGDAGRQWTEINTHALTVLRKEQVERIILLIAEANQKGTEEQRAQLKSILNEIGPEVPLTKEALTQLLDRQFVGEAHDAFVPKIEKLAKLLTSLLVDKAPYLPRLFSLYQGVTLYGQALIADQIPAIIVAEMIEGRRGINKDCIPVEFNFPNYRRTTQKTNLFYLEKQNEQSYLKYLDFCMSRAILEHDRMISKEKKLTPPIINVANAVNRRFELPLTKPRSHL